MFQYVAITSMAGEAIKRAEKDAEKKAEYDNNLCAYKAQAALYFGKFVVLGLTLALPAFIFIRLFNS